MAAEQNSIRKEWDNLIQEKKALGDTYTPSFIDYREYKNAKEQLTDHNMGKRVIYMPAVLQEVQETVKNYERLYSKEASIRRIALEQQQAAVKASASPTEEELAKYREARENLRISQSSGRSEKYDGKEYIPEIDKFENKYGRRGGRRQTRRRKNKRKSRRFR